MPTPLISALLISKIGDFPQAKCGFPVNMDTVGGNIVILPIASAIMPMTGPVYLELGNMDSESGDI
jgi:hypothetical protein